MKNFFVGLVCLCLLAFPEPVKADVIAFDDVPGSASGTYSEIPITYSGLAWDNFWVMHKGYAPGTGFETGVVSGEYAAYNGYTNPASLSGPSFTFVGAYFTTDYLGREQSLTIKGYSNEVETHSAVLLLDSLEPIWLQADWQGIDRLYFDRPGAWFVMDNFTYSVPIPATLLLFGSGIVGLIGIRRRMLRI